MQGWKLTRTQWSRKWKRANQHRPTNYELCASACFHIAVCCCFSDTVYIFQIRSFCMCCYLKRCQVISLCAASLPGVSKYKKIYIDILTEAPDSIMVHTCSHISGTLAAAYFALLLRGHGSMDACVMLSSCRTDTQTHTVCTRTAVCTQHCVRAQQHACIFRDLFCWLHCLCLVPPTHI